MKVAIGVITDDANHILITQRPHHVAQGARWEFPGGKLLDNELPEQALVREIKEELGINILQWQHLGDVFYGSVHLIVFHVIQFQGIPTCLEGQLGMKWVDKDQLKYEDFPDANEEVLNLIARNYSRETMLA